MTNNISWLKWEPIRYRGFLVKYIGPTIYNNTKISIKDTWHNVRLTISYDSLPEGHNILDKATLFLKTIGIEVVGIVGDDVSDTLLTTNFSTPLKKPKVIK